MKNQLKMFAVVAVLFAGVIFAHSTSAQTPPSILVEAPFEGNVFALNGVVPVSWVQTHSSTVVDVVLVRNGLDYHKVYASSGAGINYFALDTNELELPEASDYQIQICDDAVEVTPGNRYCSPVSETFTLTDDVIPSISIISPVTDKTYYMANPFAVVWNQNYSAEEVTITLYGNGGVYDLGAPSAASGNNTFYPNLASFGLADALYSIEVCDPALVDVNQPPTKYVCGQMQFFNITNAAQPTTTLTLVKSGTSGVVSFQGAGCTSTCSHTVFQDVPLTISATPGSPTSMFTEWTSGCSGTNRVCTLSITSNTTVTALFSPAFMVSVSKNGTGTGVVTGGGVNCGTTCATRSALNGSVTLTAVPNAGSQFTGWSGQGCSGTGTCTVTSATTGIKSVTATFSAI